MKISISGIIILLVSLLPTIWSSAVPAFPYPIKILQPDGTELSYYLKGDEFFHYKTSLDGYLLTRDKHGILTYAAPDSLGNITSLNVKANDINKRTALEKRLLRKLVPNINLLKVVLQHRALRAPGTLQKSNIQHVYPLNGTPKSLVILVNFSDVKFVTPQPQTAFTNLLNQKGYSTNGGTGSAKDYFRDNSMGVFNPQFDVVGPYNLPQNMAYYGANNSSGQDSNPQQMVIDACTLAHNAGVNFSQYDTDKNGLVDNVFIYYAGYNEAEGGPANSIWPHRWTLANYNTVFDGVSVFDYACTSELRGSSGSNMCGVGTFCHEFGHVLGLVDYYATDNSTHQTLSYWNIMDSGPYLNLGRTPPAYSAFDRFYLGWLKPTELLNGGDFVLDTLTTSNKAMIVTQNGNSNLVGSNPTPPEFFTLENRQNTGWDSYLPGHGMLVSHIYYNASTWASNTVNNDPNAMGYSIVEADGIADNNTLSGDPFPGTSNVKQCNLILRNGTDIKKPLKNISEVLGKIYFHFASNITCIGSLSPFSTVQGTPSAVQSIIVSGTKLPAPIVLNFSVGLHFEIKRQTDPESSWAKTLTLTPSADSTVLATVIQIRYNPTVPSYAEPHYDVLTLTSATDIVNLSLTGTSTRPVYVVPPIATNPTSETFSSFTANWDSVFDATGYYLTVYSIESGESSLTQGFDNGLTVYPDWTITASGISNSSLYSGKAVPSIQFSTTGEYVISEKYMLPVSKLSFYLRPLGENSGGFLVQGQTATGSWEKIDSILVVAEPQGYDTSLRIKSYSFSTPKYWRFRFTFYRGVGAVTFDDVTATFADKLNYVLKDQWETTNAVLISNLSPLTEYIYKVRASDKNTIHNYENITDFSNEIQTKTLAYPLAKALLVTVDQNKIITVYLPDLLAPIQVYNLVGQLIKTIAPQDNMVQINDLAKNQLYIIKSGNRIAKVVI